MCERFVPSWKSFSPTNRELWVARRSLLLVYLFSCPYWRPSLNYGSVRAGILTTLDLRFSIRLTPYRLLLTA
jgi:hypothetical protein